MSAFEGKVKSTGTAAYGKKFGWIKYDPGNEDDDDEIWFQWDESKGATPAQGAPVTFTRVTHPDADIDPDKKGTYIAKDVKGVKT